MAKRRSKNFDPDERIEALTEWARDNLDFERAIRAFAVARVRGDLLEQQLAQVTAHASRAMVMAEQLPQAIKRQATLMDESISALNSQREQSEGIVASVIPEALLQGINLGQRSAKARVSTRNKVAADARHDKPGGAREKAAAIRAIWASGKYSSRALCAEQECAALDMSFDAARKALRNTPKPA